MKQFPSTLLVHNEKEVDTNTNPGVFGPLPGLPSAPAKWILLLFRLPTTILCPSSSLVSPLSCVLVDGILCLMASFAMVLMCAVSFQNNLDPKNS